MLTAAIAFCALPTAEGTPYVKAIEADGRPLPLPKSNIERATAPSLVQMLDFFIEENDFPPPPSAIGSSWKAMTATGGTQAEKCVFA